MKKTLCLLTLLISQASLASDTQPIAKDIIDVNQINPSILVDARYASTNNFVGAKVDGYLAGKCLLQAKAAQALSDVQTELKTKGLALKVFDCFRPQRAVNHFVRWAENINDKSTKAQYYPNVAKSALFEKGYIAAKSGHSRGATVDLTLIRLDNKHEVDMGSPFDFFDSVSHTVTDKVSAQQQSNRLVLKNAMEKHGFANYSQEWWHYTYKPEPYPKTYFDGDIK